MNQLFDKKYPVTSSLLLLTAGVFLSMLLVRGFDYESVQTVYDFGGVIGAEIQVDPSQSWRLLAAMFVHIGLQHFVLNMVTLQSFSSPLHLVRFNGQSFCDDLFPRSRSSWGFYRLVRHLWGHCQFALHCSESLHSVSEPKLYFIDPGQYPL